jgi:hypothetical protein
MAKQPIDLVMPVLRDIQATLAEHGRGRASIKADLHRQGVKIDELFESSVTALGLAGRANVQHEVLQKRLDELRERVEHLEEQH